MSISFIGAHQQAGASIAGSLGNAVGDLLIAHSARHYSNIPPSLAPGWTYLDSIGTGSASSLVAYRISESTDELSGTWTNAEMLQVAVYRADRTWLQPIISSGNGSARPAVFPALTLEDASESWIVRTVAGFGDFVGNTFNAPHYGEQRTIVGGDATPLLRIVDSNGSVVANPSAFNQDYSTYAGSTSWHARTIQLREAVEPSAKLHTFTDDFENPLDPSKWTIEANYDSGVEIKASSGLLSYHSDAGANTMFTNEYYDFKDSHALIQFVAFMEAPVGHGKNFSFILGNDSDSFGFIIYEDEDSGDVTLMAADVNSFFGFPNEFSFEPVATPYDPVAHQWLRIRESGGVIYFETAANAGELNWQAFASGVHSISNLNVRLSIGTFLGWGSFFADNLNTLPVAPPGLSVKQYVSGNWERIGVLKGYNGSDWVSAKAWDGTKWIPEATEAA